MSEKKAPGKLARAKGTQRATATGKKSKGFMDEERAAMKERAQEMKAAARADKDKAVMLARIAEIPEPDRALAERLHAIIKASVPALVAVHLTDLVDCRHASLL